MRQVFVLKSGAVVSFEGHKKMTQEEAEKFVMNMDKKMDGAMKGLDQAMKGLDQGLKSMSDGLDVMSRSMNF